MITSWNPSLISQELDEIKDWVLHLHAQEDKTDRCTSRGMGGELVRNVGLMLVQG
jgi:hypothetical protein